MDGASHAIRPFSDRPRSQKAHLAVLTTTDRLLCEVGFADLTIDKIATLSRVSTATIYQHWPTKTAIVAEAFGRAANAAIPCPQGLDPLEDLIDVFVAATAGHSISGDQIIVQLLAACSIEPNGALYLQEYYLRPLCDKLRPLWVRAMEAGFFAENPDFELVVDVIFGAAVFRLMRGKATTDADSMRPTIDLAVRRLAAQRP